jgi:hypothetical protein
LNQNLSNCGGPLNTGKEKLQDCLDQSRINFQGKNGSTMVWSLLKLDEDYSELQMGLVENPTLWISKQSSSFGGQRRKTAEESTFNCNEAHFWVFC